MALLDSLKNKIVDKAKESTESKLTPEEKAQKADRERRRRLDLQQKKYDDERIAFENKKRKRRNIFVLSFGAILLALIIIISFSIDGAIKESRYNNGCDSIISGEYNEAYKYFEKLRNDYRETKKLRALSKTLAEYDKSKADTYSKTALELEKLDSFENKKIQRLRDKKYKEASKLNEDYLNALETAEQVEITITNACTNVTLESYEKIVRAKQYYEAQSDEVKSHIKNAYMLDDAINDISTFKSYYDNAKAVENKINAIGKVTLKSKDKINEAREAYDALSYDEADYVSNYSKLVKAEKKYKKLKKKEKEKNKDKTTTKKK